MPVLHDPREWTMNGVRCGPCREAKRPPLTPMPEPIDDVEYFRRSLFRALKVPMPKNEAEIDGQWVDSKPLPGPMFGWLTRAVRRVWRGLWGNLWRVRWHPDHAASGLRWRMFLWSWQMIAYEDGRWEVRRKSETEAVASGGIGGKGAAIRGLIGAVVGGRVQR